MDDSKDRDLLFGFAAVARRFVQPNDLVEATLAWTQHKNQSLVEVLVDRGAITEAQRAAVDSLLDEALNGEAEDNGPSLLDADVFGAVRNALQRIGDVELRESLHRIGESIEDAPQQPTIVGDEQRFEIHRELARGGLGEVFVAQDKQLNRNVALKQILERLEGHPSAKDRFLMEAEITGRLEHPGVVPVYALGQRPDGRFYYAMRLIRGVTLEDEIQAYFDASEKRTSAERNLELRKLLRRFIDICNTIDYAHSRGVIHRDLKPANIMLGKYGETLVVDWGLAKQVGVEEAHDGNESLLVPGSGSGSAATQFGSAIGTPRYMSPEQAAGRLDRIGPASDIYGLGATLYQLLTARPPVTDKSVDRVLDRVERGDFPPPRSVRLNVPKPLDAICRKAMHLHVSDRYESAGELAQDIERWLADQRVKAYREPILATAARSVRRHQTAAVSGIVTIVLLCIAAVVGSIFWQQSQLRQQQHVHELKQQELLRKEEDRQRLAERRASALADLRFGLAEAKAGRFESALSFFQQGEQACADDASLDDTRAEMSRRREQMLNLVKFHQLSDDAMDVVITEEDERAMILMASAMRSLGVFEHADWWDHLPVEGLDPRDANRIEKRVHLGLIILASLILKNTMTPQIIVSRKTGLSLPRSDQQRSMEAAFRRIVNLARSYRPSQWLTRVEQSHDYWMGHLESVGAAPSWRADNFPDAFMLSCMCLTVSQSGELGIGSDPAKEFLDIPDEELKQKQKQFLRQATELEPDDYFATTITAWADWHAGDFDSAVTRLSYAIALQPDRRLAYVMRSYTYFKQAMAAEGDNRRRILKLALQDVQVPANSHVRNESVDWMRGIVLRHLGNNTQAVAAYLSALSLEPPLDMIRAQQWVLLVKQTDPNRIRRLGFFLPERIEHVRDFAENVLHAHDGDNPQYALLEAATALAIVNDRTKSTRPEEEKLRRLAKVQSLASRVLELASQQTEASPVLVSHAHAIQGDGHRIRARIYLNRERAGAGKPTLEANELDLEEQEEQELRSARDAFSKSLSLNSENTMAASGMAAVLERIALRSDDPSHLKLALDAYEAFAAVARIDWQSVLAQQGRFRLLLQQQNWAKANATLDRMLELDPGQNFGQFRELAQSVGAAAIVEQLDALQIGAQVEDACADQAPVLTLPIRNGHFELGLSSYWQPWSIQGSCLAEAETVARTRPDGKGLYSLLIQHHSARSDEASAQLEQIVPARAGVRYRISFWARTENLAASGLQIVVDDNGQNTVVTLPAGSHDWHQLDGEFVTPAARDETQPRRPIRVKIVSRGPGKTWLDDIRIEVQP